MVETALKLPPPGVRIDLPHALIALGSLRPVDEDDGHAQLRAFVRRRRESERLPTLAVSTIHKAKGREFDHVVVAHCSATPFRDDAESRRLLYVAISRARHSVTILASGSHPSPLLRLAT
ncbi:MAG: ATP-binding domain-containing protein [bacterium]